MANLYNYKNSTNYQMIFPIKCVDHSGFGNRYRKNPNAAKKQMKSNVANEIKNKKPLQIWKVLRKENAWRILKIFNRIILNTFNPHNTACGLLVLFSCVFEKNRIGHNGFVLRKFWTEKRTSFRKACLLFVGRLEILLQTVQIYVLILVYRINLIRNYTVT